MNRTAHPHCPVLPLVRLFAVLLALWLPAPDPLAASEGPAGGPPFGKLQKRLVASGLDARQVADLYGRPEVAFETRGVSLFFVHSEARLDYDQFLAPDRIGKARQYLEAHARALEGNRREYGVAPEVVAAILLVETQLGTFTGRQSVLNILSTMASLSDADTRERFWADIDPSRRLPRADFEKKADQKSAWAFDELTAFLAFADREGMDPAVVPGSYAGAMGICQFMPSNALRLGVDGNGDGRVDLFDHADAIFSVGNYLTHHGWRPDLPRERAYKVILRYNYSRPYANTVLDIAKRLKTE
jgi:membrane-bound lytic murein transglycosylase B